MASSQLMLSPRATWGTSSVSSMAYQVPLPPRACSKAWAHHLWVYNRTQLSNRGTQVHLRGCGSGRQQPELASFETRSRCWEDYAEPEKVSSCKGGIDIDVGQMFETVPPMSSHRPSVLARALTHVLSIRGDGVPPSAAPGRASAAPQRPATAGTDSRSRPPEPDRHVTTHRTAATSTSGYAKPVIVPRLPQRSSSSK